MSEQVTGEIGLLDAVIADLLGSWPPYYAVRALPGLGPVLAAVAVAEIGDISRFPSPGRLCSWAGLTPRHRESDLKVARGHLTKQGSPILRWAGNEQGMALCAAPGAASVSGQAPGCGHPFGFPRVASPRGMGRYACRKRDQSDARPRRPGAGARPGTDHALPGSGPAHPASAARLRAASDLTCPSRMA